MVWRDCLGFCEVIEPVEPLGMKVFHDKHHAGFALRPGEQHEVIRAEVEHSGCFPS
jgi:hypothetical protein